MSSAERWDRIAQALGPRAQRDAPLGARTTYRVGGPAAVWFQAGDEADLIRLGTVLAAERARGAVVDVVVVGRGSNMLVSDAGFGGVAVGLGPEFEWMEIDAPAVGEAPVARAGSALALPVLARRSAAAGLRGLEWAVGVPGTVGGAVRMNAGGHGGDVSRCLAWARILDLSHPEVAASIVAVEDLGLGYRRSALTTTQVVTEAAFRARSGRSSDAEALIAEVVAWRVANQPGGANAGSVFANPTGASAGALVEEAGLKGHRLGSAQVSPKHANFISASAGGRAQDVSDLIDHVRAEVEARCGVRLELELRRVGFGPSALTEEE